MMSYPATIENVQIQTISWCNRSCEFCPSQKFDRKPNLMTLETFQRVLDELASIGFAGRISPYLQGEPLLDKRMPQLIEMIRKTLPGSKILMQSNGDFLTVEKGEAVFGAGLHKLILNAYDSNGDRSATLNRIADELVGKVPGLRKLKGNFQTMIRPEPPGNVTREILIEDKSWWTRDSQDNWAGNVPGMPPLKTPINKYCFRPFEHLSVHYNGNVVLCCCDWKGEVVFGNLNESSLTDILAGEVATTYRHNLAHQNRRMPLCERCDFKGKHPLTARIKHFLRRRLNLR
ncbi:MAG: SPASM domain-containing protein [Thermodesulfobacteriota bacterium]